MDIDDEQTNDEDWDAGSDWIACPECGVDIYSESEQCPHCRHYIESDQHHWSNRSLSSRRWFTLIVWLVVISLVLPFAWVLFAMLARLNR